MARSRRRAWFVAAIWLGISSSIVAQERDREAELRGSRQMIWQMVLRAVQGIAEDAPEWAGDAAGDWGKVVSFAAGETLEGELLPVYQYVGETARTDKQLGSTSTSRGTTSLLEKPGLPTLLAFAIERGAIQQEQSGSDITLRSSPAALVKPLYHPPTRRPL